MRDFPAAVRRHLHRGTALAALKRRISALLGRKPTTRFNVRTASEAASLLAQLASEVGREGCRRVLVIGRNAEFVELLSRAFQNARLQWAHVQGDIAGITAADVADVGCIVLAELDSRSHLALAAELLGNPATAPVPMEYVALPRLENETLSRRDRFESRDFVSPLLAVKGGLFYRIYEESLSRFELKTDVRDYLDLAQLLQSVVDRRVDGNVAEFGSFKGHSGYLTSRTLQALGSYKVLFMFDMFENFPVESAGVDRFWSGTHQVDFESVKAKFTDRPNVRLIKGDFSETLPETDTGQLALAFIDCDSYRGTRYLLEALWEQRLATSGVLVLEDYGHAALLGNRVAAHEFFDGRQDALTFFSQFSGFFIAVKLATPSAV